MKPNLVAIVGPTGTGKSALAISLAKQLANEGHPAEIVNADAMQLYRGMDIGTAKSTIDERQGINHHLIDVLSVREESTAAKYQQIAREKIRELQSNGILPILVGGSMLYLAACLNKFEFPGRDEKLRAELEIELQEYGSLAMHEKLARIDPIAASRIIPENGRRVVRALEIVMLTGKPFAAALPAEIQSWQPVLEIGLRMPREKLIPRLEARVRRMWSEGIVDEVRALESQGLREGKTASAAIGYAQALAQLDGTMTADQAMDATSQLTLRYARRQMSWFRRDSRIVWMDVEASDLVNHCLSTVLKEVSFRFDLGLKA